MWVTGRPGDRVCPTTGPNSDLYQPETEIGAAGSAACPARNSSVPGAPDLDRVEPTVPVLLLMPALLVAVSARPPRGSELYGFEVLHVCGGVFLVPACARSQETCPHEVAGSVLGRELR